jgi:hypothetical protein
MSRGVLMVAHNNTEIDYFKIACANALMVKKNLGVPVTLVTDSGTLNWGKTALTEEFVNSCFEGVIVVDRDYMFENTRNFSDTRYSTKPLQFYNCNHWQVYDLSPYDETLFIDCDYLIMSAALNNCWGSKNEVMINHKIFSPLDINEPYTRTIDDTGITLYWATVIYFKKSSIAQHLFSLVKDIQENYAYYRDLYYFTNGMFRNDNAFSVAIHMLNGFRNGDSAVQELPITGLLMCWDTNDIQKINGLNDITLYVDKKTQTGDFLLTRIKGIDAHIINKWAINRHADRLIELYKEQV